MKKWFSLLFYAAMLSTACAGGRGGHNTTFDINFFPGSTITTINCNGATDSAALASFVSAGVSANPAKQVLHLVGPICFFESNATLVWDGAATHAAIQNATIWAYGVTTNAAYVGGNGFPTDNVHEGLIETVSAGAISVTLKTIGDASRFSVNDNIIIGGLSLQFGGSPPNLQFFEYKVITAISGAVITLSSPLANSYKSTWPLIDTNPSQGPAAIYLLRPSWLNNTKVFGLTINSASEVVALGRTIQLVDVNVATSANIAPSVSQSFFAAFSNLGSPEVDKAIELANIYRGGGTVFTVQSPVTRLVLDSITLAISLNGTGTNTVINNSLIPFIAVGPTFYGHGNSIVSDGTTISGSQGSVHYLPATSYSFLAGTFTVANSDPLWPNAVALAVPGFRYYLGCNHGEIATPVTTFTITDVRMDGSNFIFDTNMPSFPATPPKCDGVNDYSGINAWQSETIKQINSPAGSVSIIGYAP